MHSWSTLCSKLLKLCMTELISWVRSRRLNGFQALSIRLLRRSITGEILTKLWMFTRMPEGCLLIWIVWPNAWFTRCCSWLLNATLLSKDSTLKRRSSLWKLASHSFTLQFPPSKITISRLDSSCLQAKSLSLMASLVKRIHYAKPFSLLLRKTSIQCLALWRRLLMYFATSLGS